MVLLEAMSPRFLALVVLSVLPGLLHASGEDYRSRTARGLAIYKDHAFASDKTAELFEYVEHREFHAVTYITTTRGNKITVPVKNAEVFFLPYPGKGEATPEQAIAIIDLTQERFPQYAPQIRPLRAAWLREGRRDPAQISKEMDERESNRTLGESFARWLKGLFPPRPFTPSPSPLDPPKKAAPPQEETQPEPAPESQSGKKDAEKSDFDSNMDKIKEYYDASKTLQNGTTE